MIDPSDTINIRLTQETLVDILNKLRDSNITSFQIAEDEINISVNTKKISETITIPILYRN